VQFAVRTARADDTGAAYALLAAWERDLLGQAEISEAIFANADAVADASYVAEIAGRVVGHATVHGASVNLIVGPDWRRRGIGTALLGSAEGAASSAVLRLVGITLERAAAPFAAANGYAKVIDVWRMVVDPRRAAGNPMYPPGVAVRTYRDGDAPALKALLDIAYAEAGDRPMPFADWRALMLANPGFDPSVWFLAFAQGRMVGAALNWRDGFVKDLVVHPEWRRRGLGSALMAQTLSEFARRGLDRVALKTDSANPTRAWQLYERIGMTAERTYEVFEKRVATGLLVGGSPAP
jgi:mycothiol synthase